MKKNLFVTLPFLAVAAISTGLEQRATVVWLIVATGFLSAILHTLFDIYEAIRDKS